MDFVAVEKCYSHVSFRAPSDASSDHIPGHSPTSSVSNNHDFDLLETPLTPAITRASRASISRNITRFTTHGTTYTSDPSFEVDFDGDDRRNPRNWSSLYKATVLFFVSFSTLIVVLYSTSYTAAMGAMGKEFGVANESITTLGVTTYLVGLAFGSLILAPISETYGRKPVYTIAMFCFFILVLPAALAKNIITVIIVRFFGAVAGSAMIANAPGTIGDIVSDDYRALAFSIWAIGPMNGPVVGPLIGGFITEYKGWRWANWVVMIAGGVAFFMMLVIEETYAPAILQRMAKKSRKESGENRYWSRFDVRVGFLELMKVNLSRPFSMAVKEPICIFWNVYIAIIYGILYLCFVAYPIVFTEYRGWSIGQSGLAFLGIGVGTMITICLASPIKKMIDAHKPDADGIVPPESMMSVVCIAAILIPVGQLWFSWTGVPVSIHPAVSIAAGIPFGMGNSAVFIYASNYLVHSYGIYAASAMAGNSVIRSILGATLPLAGPSMYRALGPNWAGTVLGLLEVVIIPIPFIFYRYGGKIRQKSTLIREMREIEEKQERKRRRAEEKLRRQQITLEEAVKEVADAGKDSKVLSEKEIEIESDLSRVQGLTRISEDV